MKEKKHTSIDNQLEKLKGRNITIDQHEEKEIKKILERNNYYNVINAYKDPFLEEKYKDENGNQDGTSDHVGIVTRTDITNRNIYTIEGNTSNKCAERMYSFDDVQVMGYGSPKYE